MATKPHKAPVDRPDIGSATERSAHRATRAAETASRRDRLGRGNRKVRELLIKQSGMSLRDIQQMVHHLAGFLSSSHQSTLEDLALAACVLRTIDRNGYNKFISGERNLFETAASFREKLDLNLDYNPDFDLNGEDFLRRYLIALVLCLDSREFRNVNDDSFIERFVEAGVGSEEQGKVIQGLCSEVRSSLPARPSREYIDNLLNVLE